jgi:beta-glucosidase
MAGINPHTVVCLVCGSMVMIDEWADYVPAVLYSWYAGMGGGSALARVLFGDVNPSGKLPFTIPSSADHLPYFSSTDPDITYDLYHGYTLLDKNDQKPAYPFGFGLSYTTYAYGDLCVEKSSQGLEVTIQATNTGSRDGEEVVQVYVGMENPRVERQEKLLKGFAKVALPAGATAAVKISIPCDRVASNQCKRPGPRREFPTGYWSRGSDRVHPQNRGRPKPTTPDVSRASVA